MTRNDTGIANDPPLPLPQTAEGIVDTTGQVGSHDHNHRVACNIWPDLTCDVRKSSTQSQWRVKLGENAKCSIDQSASHVRSVVSRWGQVSHSGVLWSGHLWKATDTDLAFVWSLPNWKLAEKWTPEISYKLPYFMPWQTVNSGGFGVSSNTHDIQLDDR